MRGPVRGRCVDKPRALFLRNATRREASIVTDQTAYSAWAAFLRLWLVMAFSFVLIKLLFNFVVLGWVDLRSNAFKELLVLPLGQSIVFWIITRRRRSDPPAS